MLMGTSIMPGIMQAEGARLHGRALLHADVMWAPSRAHPKHSPQTSALLPPVWTPVAGSASQAGQYMFSTRLCPQVNLWGHCTAPTLTQGGLHREPTQPKPPTLNP